MGQSDETIANIVIAVENALAAQSGGDNQSLVQSLLNTSRLQTNFHGLNNPSFPSSSQVPLTSSVFQNLSASITPNTILQTNTIPNVSSIANNNNLTINTSNIPTGNIIDVWSKFNYSRASKMLPPISFDMFKGLYEAKIRQNAQQSLLNTIPPLQHQQQLPPTAWFSNNVTTANPAPQNAPGQLTKSFSSTSVSLNPSINSHSQNAPQEPRQILQSTITPNQTLIVLRIAGKLLKSGKQLEPPLSHSEICSLLEADPRKLPQSLTPLVNDELVKQIHGNHQQTKRKRDDGQEGEFQPPKYDEEYESMDRQVESSPQQDVGTMKPIQTLAPVRNQSHGVSIDVSADDLEYIKSRLPELKVMHQNIPQLMNTFSSATGKESQIKHLAQIRDLLDLQMNADEKTIYVNRAQVDYLKKKLTDLYLDGRRILVQKPKTSVPASIPKPQPSAAPFLTPFVAQLNDNAVSTIHTPQLPTSWPLATIPLEKARDLVLKVQSHQTPAIVTQQLDQQLKMNAPTTNLTFAILENLVKGYNTTIQQEQNVQPQLNKEETCPAKTDSQDFTQNNQTIQPSTIQSPTVQLSSSALSVPRKSDILNALSELGTNSWNLHNTNSQAAKPLIEPGFNPNLQRTRIIENGYGGLETVPVDDEFLGWDESETNDLDFMLGTDHVVQHKLVSQIPFRAQRATPTNTQTVEEEINDIEAMFGRKGRIYRLSGQDEAESLVVSFGQVDSPCREDNMAVFTINPRGAYEERVLSVLRAGGKDSVLAATLCGGGCWMAEDRPLVRGSHRMKDIMIDVFDE
ncbi:UNVERIFIED_CONTAM: hypothetical protein HDU68_000536 [Siphonaria sp. JEL0065]|nr:hypothetical protein HDU68_000536 [Siphonaria sp. JEL0065]